VLGEALDYLEKLWSDLILFKSFEVLGKSLDHLETLWSTSRGFRLFGKAVD
jgi:uncharacterized protein YbdZ (MbtH family)